MVLLNYIGQIISDLLMIVGMFFTSAGVLGLFKLPDLLSRQHANGLIDTAGIMFICLGLSVRPPIHTLISLKIILTGVLLTLISAPTSTTLVRAALMFKSLSKHKNNK